LGCFHYWFPRMCRVLSHTSDVSFWRTSCHLDRVLLAHHHVILILTSTCPQSFRRHHCGRWWSPFPRCCRLFHRKL
jgi:hypothetical protein